MRSVTFKNLPLCSAVWLMLTAAAVPSLAFQTSGCIGGSLLRSPAWKTAHNCVNVRGSSQLWRCSASVNEAESELLSLVSNTKGRGQRASSDELNRISNALTQLESDGGVQNPITAPEIRGKWELLYTSKSSFDIRNPLGKRVDGSNPGLEGVIPAILGDDRAADFSSSPIQRTVTSIDGIKVIQEIVLEGPEPRVDQRVEISDTVYLRLSATASTSPENLQRIDFTFDLAYFQLGPLRVPYPVPFRLLGDEAKGWLDTTFLSDQLRISKGNKGTTFVLRKISD